MSNTDRIGIMERRRALETAKNMLYSKIGKAVLDENKFPDRTLQLQMRRIDVESKKNSSLIDNEKKMFKRERLIYNLEPTILIERPASPSQQMTEDPRPRYMTEVRKPEVVRVPEMPPTIDAFTVLKRKTKNIWETKYTDEDMSRKFRSIILKSPRLNPEESDEIDKGYAIYRPASKNEEAEQKRIEEKKKEKIALLREVQRSPSPDAQLAFITQLEQEAGIRSLKSGGSRSVRSIVSQSPTSQTKPSAIELHFNPFHLEKFEKIRHKQKWKYYSKIKNV